MKKLVFAAVFFAAAGPAGAQQVQLLEDQPEQDQKKTSSGSGDMPQIIMPSDENSQAAAVPEPGQAGTALPGTPPAPEGPKNTEPAPHAMEKHKIFRSVIPAAGTATVKAAQANPAVAVSSVPARAPEFSAPASDTSAVKAISAQPPAAAAGPAPAKAPPSASSVVTGALPTLESVAAAAPKPSGAAASAAAKPAEAIKPAAASKPAAPQVLKPAETVPTVSAAPRKTAAVRAAPPAAMPLVSPAPAKTAAMPPPPAAKPAREAPTAPGAGFSVVKTHNVAGGDTLWDLSGKYYHDPYKWGKIYNANLKTLSNPDRIYPDQQLVIPGVTEEVKPEVRKAEAVSTEEKTGEEQLPGSELIQPVRVPETAPSGSAAPKTAVVAQTVAVNAAPAAAKAKPVQPSLNEDMVDFERSDLSEEMPENQKEWTSEEKLVPDDWNGDGVISATGKNGDDEAGLLSVSGDIVEVSLSGSAAVKTGDFLGVYMKGSAVYDKAGARLGREVQPVGMLEVLSADGRRVKASVVNATTAIESGYVVKKK